MKRHCNVCCSAQRLGHCLALKRLISVVLVVLMSLEPYKCCLQAAELFSRGKARSGLHQHQQESPACRNFHLYRFKSVEVKLRFGLLRKMAHHGDSNASIALVNAHSKAHRQGAPRHRAEDCPELGGLSEDWTWSQGYGSGAHVLLVAWPARFCCQHEAAQHIFQPAQASQLQPTDAFLAIFQTISTRIRICKALSLGNVPEVCMECQRD